MKADVVGIAAGGDDTLMHKAICGDNRKFRLCAATVNAQIQRRVVLPQQIVHQDTEKGCNAHQVFQVRRRYAPLPVGHCLEADTQALGKSTLGQSLLLPQGADAAAQQIVVQHKIRSLQ